MQATSTPIVRVRQAANMFYSVLANCLKRFEDGTALVRFAAGDFRIVPIELIEPATDAEAREYYRAWLRHTLTHKFDPLLRNPDVRGC
jgi:hypothetical protein